MVCQLCGAVNAFGHITIKGEKTSEHEFVSKETAKNRQEIDFDRDFSKVEKWSFLTIF